MNKTLQFTSDFAFYLLVEAGEGVGRSVQDRH